MTMPIQNAYIFIKKDDINDCIKYGMKLSKYNNISAKIKNSTKKGILAYMSPKDSDKYNDSNFDILRIKLNDVDSYVLNDDEKNEILNITEYNLGSFENPKIFIASSIMPENIYRYNRILDVPLIIQNSKEFFNMRKEEIENEIENSKYTFSDLLKRKNNR